MVEDALSPSLQKLVKHKKNRVIVFLGFKKEFSFQYEIHNLPRGEHEFPLIIIMTCDFLGMTEKEERIKQVETILVFPSNQEFAHVPANQILEQSMLLTRVMKIGKAQRLLEFANISQEIVSRGLIGRLLLNGLTWSQRNLSNTLL